MDCYKICTYKICICTQTFNKMGTVERCKNCKIQYLRTVLRRSVDIKFEGKERSDSNSSAPVRLFFFSIPMGSTMGSMKKRGLQAHLSSLSIANRQGNTTWGQAEQNKRQTKVKTITREQN